MMEDAPALFIAIEQSDLAASIRQSSWAYPLANIGHIVSLVVFAGAVSVMDLRLAGAFGATAPGPLIARARTVAIIAFVGLLLSGLTLFAAEASHIILNPVFQIKLALIALGLINVAVYEFALKARIASIPAGKVMPSAVRTAGIMSLTIWIVVAALGRTIAYF